MRDLWQALALIADNQDGILERLRLIVGFELTNLKDIVKIGDDPDDPRHLKLKRQPTWQTLDKLSSELRKYGLHLSAYELSELNRWIYEDQIDFGKKSFAALRRYWDSLGAVGAGSRANPQFMTAVGAMAIDAELRRLLANGSSLSEHGFSLTPNEITELRQAVQPGKPADIAASEFFKFSWSGSTCESVHVHLPGWIHTNV